MDASSLFSSFLAMGNNPQQIEQMVFNQYPQLRVLSNQMKQSGLSPVQFVMQYAQQRNIPIQENQVMSLYQQMLQMTPRRY